MSCPHPPDYVSYAKMIAGNGAEHIIRWCWECGHRTEGAFVGKDEARELGLDKSTLEVVKDNRTEHCEVCSDLGAEEHHWAPRYLFGDESGQWPTSLLCVPCHIRWHSIVTPKMTEVT